MIRSALLCAALTAAGTMSPAYAAEHGARMEQSFKKADRNGDGVLDRDEAKMMPRVAKNFDAIDVDKDGTISRDELRASMKSKKRTMHEKGKANFAAADKNGDGVLDRDEAKAMPRVAKNFDAIDVDKDGTVSAKEIHTYMKARRQERHKQ